MKTIHLSPSSIGLFLDCPRCFWLKINQKMERPIKAFPTLPSGMDRVLKEHFDKYRQTNQLPPELTKNGFKGSLFKDQELLEVWRDWRKGLRLEIKDINVVVRGAIDDLLVEEDGETVVPFDFKTRGIKIKDDSHTHYHHQMCIYGFLLEKLGYKVSSKGYLLFYHPDKVQEDGSVVFNSEMVKVTVYPPDAEKMIKDAAILLSKPIPPKDPTCNFCAHRNDE